MIAERIHHIGASPTLKITAKAKALKAQGIDVIDFSVGEPDFPTPQNIKDAAKRAIDDNFTRYTANEGIPRLRQAIVERLREDHKLEYKPDEILVSNGAKHSIYNAIMALVNEGDEVIVPTPYWVSYPEMVKLARGVPVVVSALEENGFRLTPDQLRDAITAGTRAIILNNPSNPTGAGYRPEELERIVEICMEERLFIISDEIYEKLVFDGFPFKSIPTFGSDVRERTVLVNGVSKAYSMTGWRIGYAAAPRYVIEAMSKVQGHCTSNASSISQMAALAALEGPQYEIRRMRAEFEKRRNYVVHKLQAMPGVSCAMPQGAFYAFPNVSSFFEKEFEGAPIRNSYGLAYYLLKHANVAIVPGDAFGAPDHIRISYATSMENLEKGISRIAEALQQLKKPAKVVKIELNNATTRVKRQVPVESAVTVESRDALVAEAEAHLKYDHYFEWNANINGVVIQLRTNVGHLYDFWVENWYPAQLETDLEPHGIIYAVDGVVGREPHVFYNTDTKTGVLFNADHYGSLRNLALGLVTDIAERLFDAHGVRGMSLDVNGVGTLLLGPRGTRKTELYFALMRYEQVAFHAPDYLIVRYGGGYAAADLPERKVYIPTNTAGLFEDFTVLFDRSKCENVVTRKEDCRNDECRAQDSCVLDRGAPYCYIAAKKSHAMLDPYWIGGMRKHVKRVDIQHVFILKRDTVSPLLVEVYPDEAVRMLENAGAGAVSVPGSIRGEPFFNPHLLVRSSDRLELQARFFRRMFQSARPHVVNTGAGAIEEIASAVLAAAAD